MYFHKHLYPANFAYASTLSGKTVAVGSKKLKLSFEEYEGGIYRISLSSPNLWSKNFSQAGLSTPPKSKCGHGGGIGGKAGLVFDRNFGFKVLGNDGAPLLSSPSGHSFGLCGKSSLFLFEKEESFQFYGLGEKQKGLELSNIRTKFWNTDVWADFDSNVFINGHPDPMYVSIPYLIVKKNNSYIGILLDNPMVTFASTASTSNIAGQMAVKGEQNKGCFWMGCEDGMPEIYIIVGPSLPELTRKLQSLVGKTPLPPAWALGYQQCRWGYESLEDMDYLDSNFSRFKIPCDGFWFDIEYMDGYRVFTWDESKFPRQKDAFEKLGKKGRRIVPILDPGVKMEKGYKVYDDGKKDDVFCKTPEGTDYVGLVWPGETVFPDFSTGKGRAWWAKWVKIFAETGVSGAWLDMNDPATGHVDNMQMMFDNGKNPHETFHNQYAFGMAKASREGFLAARPNRRPFLLCRSGCTGSGKYTAIWTGDNYSNWHHLKSSIAMTLNLALSGIPFNGPDVAGFGGDVTEGLMLAWMKAGFLFPVLRNHSCRGALRQEPWVFDNDSVEVLRDYIRLRYKFRPYLYNLFIGQENTGEAIMRPLFYDFQDLPELPLAKIDDQFMVGPAVMNAPLVNPGSSRTVVLPGGRWFSLRESKWIEGGRMIREDRISKTQTPIYLRSDTIIPLAAGEIGGDNSFKPKEIEFHILLEPGENGDANCEYFFDDGESYDYKNGRRSRLALSAKVSGSSLEIRSALQEDGYGKCNARFVLYGNFDSIKLNGKTQKIKPFIIKMAGVEQKLFIV